MRMFEIATAILPVGVKEERIEPVIQIVMPGYVLSCPDTSVELLQPAPKVAREPLRPRPARGSAGAPLGQRQSKEVVYRSLFDDEGTVHIGFAKLELGVEENPPLGPP